MSHRCQLIQLLRCYGGHLWEVKPVLDQSSRRHFCPWGGGISFCVGIHTPPEKGDINRWKIFTMFHKKYIFNIFKWWDFPLSWKVCVEPAGHFGLKGNKPWNLTNRYQKWRFGKCRSLEYLCEFDIQNIDIWKEIHCPGPIILGIHVLFRGFICGWDLCEVIFGFKAFARLHLSSWNDQIFGPGKNRGALFQKERPSQAPFFQGWTVRFEG